jgi:hypothetical protein
LSITSRFLSIIGLGIILILSASIINSASAQQTPKKVFGIKITSPARGQQVTPSGNNLTVTGIASFNSTLDCNVYVIVNDVKPYHKALPIGITKPNNNNTNDYSTWKYNLVPTYGVIKTGANKVTSKLICQKNNANAGNSSTPLAKFYSINFTGTPTTIIKQQERVLKHSTNSSNSKNTGGYSLTTNNSNKTVPIVKKQKPSLLPINSTKITGAGGGNKTKTTTANVVVQTGNRSQQTNRPSQSTVSAAALLSNAGISSSSSSNKGNTHTTGTTTNSNSNSNINHGHGKSVSSGASASSTKTDNHNLVGENLVSRKQHSDNSPINEPIQTDSISKNMSAHNNNDIKKLSTPTNLSTNRVFIPKTNTNDTRKHVDQGVSPIREPQLPNGNDKIPFVMATPIHHITNGTTTSPASDQPVSVTLALNLVDKTRVVGFNSDIPIPSH